MCRAEGMGIVPWGVLGQVRTRSLAKAPRSCMTRLGPYLCWQGKYKSEAEMKARTAPVRYGMPQTEDEKRVSAALEKVAGEVGGGASLASVAVAWALAKAPYVFPVVGGSNPKYLDDVIKVRRSRVCYTLQAGRFSCARPGVHSHRRASSPAHCRPSRARSRLSRVPPPLPSPISPLSSFLPSPFSRWYGAHQVL